MSDNEDIIDGDIDDIDIDDDISYESENDLDSDNESENDLESDTESEDDYPIFIDDKDTKKNKFLTKIDDNNRMTTNIMSIFEYTAIISLRAKQISNGLSEIPNTFIDATKIIESNSLNIEEEIAKEELKQGKCPLKVRRFISEYEYEEWSANELIVF